MEFRRNAPASGTIEFWPNRVSSDPQAWPPLAKYPESGFDLASRAPSARYLGSGFDLSRTAPYAIGQAPGERMLLLKWPTIQ
jgi:hypothetical protein